MIDLHVAKLAIGDKVKRLLPNGCYRILLVNPIGVPEEDYDIQVALQDRYPIYPPYGLGVLSTCLQKRGYETDIIDLNYYQQESLKSNPETFEYNSWKQLLVKKLNEFVPDLIGLTCMFMLTHRAMAAVASYIKKVNPDMPIIAGGVHTSGASELTLKECEEIDFVGLYEGNSSLPDMVDFVNGKIEARQLTQLATLEEDDHIVISEKAQIKDDELNARPDYHELPIDQYGSLGRIGTFYWLFKDNKMCGSTVLSNRGCRARCSFCSVRNFNGKGVYNKDISAVVDEVERLRDDYGVHHIMWLDDDLFYNEGRTIGLFQEMTQRNLGVTWDASNGVIASALTEEIAQAAYESGCIGISLGIESGNDEILRSVHKPSTVKHYLEAASILRKYPRIFTRGLLMCGFPGECIGQQNDTVKLGQEMQLDWNSIQPLTLIPSTELTDWALSIGKIVEKQLIDGSQRPFLGSTGKQIQREAKEKSRAEYFQNLLLGDQNRIPVDDEIKDIWFLMDYKINYEKIHHLENKIKLQMLEKQFHSMCDRTHTGHALGHLYFALIELKLGKTEEAKYRLKRAEECLENSIYWQIRFEVLSLHEISDKLNSSLAS